MLACEVRLRIVVEQMVEPLRSRRHRFPQASEMLIFNLGFRLMLFDDLNPGAAAQLMQRLFELQPVALHQVGEDIAAGVACAEALPRAALRPHHKRRGARVSVEGAEAGVGASALLELHRLRHHVDDVDAVFNVVDDCHSNSQ